MIADQRAPAGDVGLPSGYTTYLATRSFASLDGLRALSIIAVVWFHTTGNSYAWRALDRGFLGVDFFFTISGFLIITLLLRERRNTAHISLRNFMVRRSLRIVPAYWLMLLLAACTAYLKPGSGSIAIKHDLPYALFYLSNFVSMSSLLSITWSLAAEEQFYLMVPALEKIGPKLFPYVVLPILLLTSILPPFGAFPTLIMPDFFRQTTFVPILLGVFLAHLLDHPRGWAFAALLLGRFASPLVAIGPVLLTLSYPGSDISGWPRLAIQITMMIFLAACVVRERHALVPVLRFWPFSRIGIVSYGIYLFHLLVYVLVYKLFERYGIHSQYVVFVGVLFSSWFFAEVSFRFLEVRFLTLRRRFSTGGRQQPN